MIRNSLGLTAYPDLEFKVNTEFQCVETSVAKYLEKVREKRVNSYQGWE